MAKNNTKTVAKNTLYMYLRMIFLMCISFYTSRILLATLGVEDYGIFSVVGSVAVSFSALKVLFSESIQRYLNVEKGKGNVRSQTLIFNMSLYIHVILSILFIVVVEVAGIWLLNHKLNIPPERYEVALFVLQMTILSTAIRILSVVYDAVIISNEKMGVYAIVSIIDGLYQVVIISLLPYLPFDHLKVYSASLVLLPVFLLTYQIFYCKRFEECKYQFCFDKSLFKEILSLSGWNFFGNISFTLLHEGINMLLNIYGGLAYNAARAISYKVKHAVAQINHNALAAVRPRVMQNGATLAPDDLMENIITVSRISLFSMLIPVVPVIVYCEQLLGIWLKEVPDFAVIFTRLILIGIVIRSLHEPLNIFYMTLAKIKRMMLIEMFIMLAFLGVIYISLKMDIPLSMVFVETAIMEIIIIISLLINAKLEIGIQLVHYTKDVLLLLLEMSIISVIIISVCSRYLIPYSIFTTLLYTILLVLLIVGIVFLFLNKRERDIIKKIVKK